MPRKLSELRDALLVTMSPHAVGSTCQSLDVPADVCSVRFAEGPSTGSDLIGHTARGEMMIADFDSDGRILRIELVGGGKPCQR